MYLQQLGTSAKMAVDLTLPGDHIFAKNEREIPLALYHVYIRLQYRKWMDIKVFCYVIIYVCALEGLVFTLV